MNEKISENNLLPRLFNFRSRAHISKKLSQKMSGALTPHSAQETDFNTQQITGLLTEFLGWGVFKDLSQGHSQWELFIPGMSYSRVQALR